MSDARQGDAAERERPAATASPPAASPATASPPPAASPAVVSPADSGGAAARLLAPRPSAVLDTAHLGDIEGAFGRIRIDDDRGGGGG